MSDNVPDTAAVAFPPSPSQPVAVLQNRRAQPFFGRHPWVFAGALQSFRDSAGNALKEQEISPGTAVRLVTSDGRFVATGLHNHQSRIRVRLYSWQPDELLDAEFWNRRIQLAIEARRAQFDLGNPDTACRLVFSESDQLSGLTVDWYGGYLLVQFTSQALYQHRQPIVAALQNATSPRGIWLRTEKGMREAEGLEVADGLLSGHEPPRPLFLQENGVLFGVDVQEGQKTGYFLDQRDNRMAVSRYAQGAKVLDAFCFSGGFGITAICQGGASSVLGIDSSESAIRLAAANGELNGVADRCRWQKSDVKEAIEELAEQGTQFDLVILDPPRMARTRAGLDRAINGYLRLNLTALQVLKPGGILVTCSCSGLVSREDFFEMLGEVSRQSGRHLQILESHGQPSDHPVSATCPETEYLKVCICRVQ